MHTILKDCLLDFLDIRPESTLNEMGDAIFEDAARKRDIRYNASQNPDWLICHKEVKRGTAKNTVIILAKPSLLLYCQLLKLKPKNIIRINPRHNYMSSEGRIDTFKRVYKNAELGYFGKFLVAVKVTLKPLWAYPMIVIVL